MATSARCAALISASKPTGSKLARSTSTRVRQEPLAGRRWRMIALADPCALALLPGQLERGLEDVHEQPCRRVEPGQSRRGRQPLQASIAHDAADHGASWAIDRSEEHTSELQSHVNLVCRLLLEKKKKI